jgi:hypothetical protein
VVLFIDILKIFYYLWNVMDKQFKKVLPKLFTYSSVGKVHTITVPHIAFFNKNDDVVMVYSINTQTMVLKTDYIITLRHILGLEKIKPYIGYIQNYLIVTFPSLIINTWFSPIYLNSDHHIL